ncbi:unnamed protein product [Mortierella alpina]
MSREAISLNLFACSFRVQQDQRRTLLRSPRLTMSSALAKDCLLQDRAEGAPTATVMGPEENMGFSAGSPQTALAPTASLPGKSFTTAAPQLQAGSLPEQSCCARLPPRQEAAASPTSDNANLREPSEVIPQGAGQRHGKCTTPSHGLPSAPLDLAEQLASEGSSDHVDALSPQAPGSRHGSSTKATAAEPCPAKRPASYPAAGHLVPRSIRADTDQEAVHDRPVDRSSREDTCLRTLQPLGETALLDRLNHPPSARASATASSCSSLASSPIAGRRGRRHLSVQQNSSGAWTTPLDIPSGPLPFPSHQTCPNAPLRRSRSLPSSVSSHHACFAQPDEESDDGSFGRVALEESTSLSTVPGPECKSGTPRPSYLEASNAEALSATPTSAFTELRPPLLRPPVTRSRGKSLLSPVQLQVLRRKLETKAVSIDDGGFGKGTLGYLGQKISNGGKIRVSGSNDDATRSNVSANASKTRCEQGKKQSSLTSGTPVLVLQPHDIEISMGRSSVSGRLILLIPQVHGQRFQFVSLVLHLRLKESITWTRQDLVSFEIEKEHWAQTIWEKKVMLPFQDRQVEEGERHGRNLYTGLSSAAAIAAAVTAASEAATTPFMLSPHTSTNRPSTYVANMESRTSPSTRPRSASDINRDLHAESLLPDTSVPPMDEWRWEWLIPVTKYGARPESFEGAMGMVWYELEAKCLFRWDKIDETGQVVSVGTTHSTVQAADSSQVLRPSNRGTSMGQVKSQLGPIKLLKGLGATTNTAKSIANVFGKLRAGNRDRAESRGKQTRHAVGDFVLGTQHDEYMRNSIKNAQQAATVTATALTGGVNDDQNGVGSTPLSPAQQHTNPNGMKSTGENTPTSPSEIPEPIPFLVRKVTKLYFSRPPQGPSSGAGYFPPPPPSMSLPTLPRTRRLKAIIPGAKIQVQIQVPSVIPIPGYAQTSLLVPSSKTGGLVSKSKRCDGGGDPGLLGTGTAFRDQYIGHHAGKDAKMTQAPCRLDPRYPDSFQVALTIRKVTAHDINKSDILRRRYENAEVAAKSAAKHTNGGHGEEIGLQGMPRRRFLSGTCTTSSQSNNASVPGLGTVPCERADGDANTTQNSEKYESAREGCRREIRVRKIKCEFWQKESCRIPTDDAPSRSIKFSLAPAFIYSEKEREKERVREMAAYKHDTVHRDPFDLTDGATSLLSQSPAIAISTARICNDGGISSSICSTSKCATATNCSHAPPPLKSTPLRLNAGERKGSLGSIFSTSLQRSVCSSPPARPTSAVLTPSYAYPSPAASHPFMLLIPVPLDSPKLRQTYDWPSPDVPSPVIPSAYDYAMPSSSISETGLGLGSELDSTSQSTTQDIGETASRGVGGHISPTLPNTSAKARIVVKHHLSFRLSIDVFEYEGELEQEDMDLEAIEEQQFRGAQSRQAMSVGSQNSGPAFNPDLGLRDSQGHCYALEETRGFEHLKGRTEGHHATATDSEFASSASPLPFELTGVDELDGNGAQQPSQSAPGLCSSYAGERDVDQDGERLLQKPSFFGLANALSFQRRGSQASLGTVGTNDSSSSGTTASASTLKAQTCNGVSGTSAGGRNSVLHPPADASSVNDGGAGGSGGLMAGAIGALKKKASFSGLAHALGATVASAAAHHPQPRQQPSQASSNHRRVVVRKLKDFVIRVPITVVIQVDEQGRAAEAYGTTRSCPSVRYEDIDLGHKDVTCASLRQSHAPDEEVPTPGTAVTTNPISTAISVTTEPSGGTEEPKSTIVLTGAEGFPLVSKVAAPKEASSILTRSDEIVSSSSTSHWHDGLWSEQENGQCGYGLELADEEFGEDFIVVDAEEVGGDEF